MAVIEKSVEEFGRQTSAEEKRKKTGYEEEDQLALAHFSDSRNYSNPTSSPKPISMVAFHQDKNDTSLSYEQKQTLPDHDKAKRCAKERAEEVQANLDPKFPSFVKNMLPSHVSGGFWLGLPTKFCSSHLPKEDVMMTLVDENQKEFSVKFLPRKTGLSGGWKGFSIAHKLVEKDVLVFQLIKDTKFQVYIIRAYGLGGIDGAVGVLTLDSHSKCSTQGMHVMTTEKTATKSQKTSLTSALPPSEEEETESNSEEVGSEVFEGIRFLENAVEFKDVKTIESFTIAVNGLIIDSEIPKDARTKYYKLCCSRGAFLHENLLDGMNINLAAGAISETVHIADAIQTSNVSTSEDNFIAWDKSLAALEQLGMNVGFLRARLQRLKSIAFESEIDSKRYVEAQLGRDNMEKEVITVSGKLAELEKVLKMLDSEIKTLENKELKG
ncbi:B3 domain-containing protein [Thalictrum thalictroides]|uniref:B3 domain-containing protein n=1 Tax=Thalictrum thalictroides TaxID=46969 RepID=A0A7J6XBC4_THATH|nr:B3 domain-containing protein [Thalictrum thalictroides]